jgi:hypothetical protein
MLSSMFLRMRNLAAFLVAAPICAQAAPTMLMARIDLKPLGVKATKHGDASDTGIELLFLSDRFLVVVLEEDRPEESWSRQLLLYDLEGGTARLKKVRALGIEVLPVSTGRRIMYIKVLERINSDHFAYVTYRGKAGRQICDTDLNCRSGGLTEAPAIATQVKNCDRSDLLGFIDGHRAVCTFPGRRAKYSAAVMDTGGRVLYKVEQQTLPWDAEMVNSAEGKRFGLVWQSNSVIQLLNPLACIDECPPAARERLEVFNSADGKKVEGFAWDPRPFNIDALPALSPSGDTAAFIDEDELVVYALKAFP